MQTEMTLDLSFLSLTAAELVIHENALNCAQNYRRAEGPLLAAIDAVDRARLADKFRTSTFQYCVEYLKLTPACAYYFQAVARKSREFPELRKAIENGRSVGCEGRASRERDDRREQRRLDEKSERASEG